MKFRKMLTIGGVCLAGSILLTVCGSNQNALAADKSDAVRISWWGNDDRHQATLAAIKAFNKKYPDIKVKAEYSGWEGTEQKMATQITGATEADVMQVNYDWLAQYSPDGKGFANINKLKGLDLSGYDKSTLASGKVGGVLNAVPFSEGVYVWAYNDKAFKANGISEDEIPTTWDGYIKAAKKFKKGYYPATSNTYTLLTYLQQKTGKTILSNSGKMNYSKKTLTAGFKWYKNLMDKKVIPSAAESKEQADSNQGMTSKKMLDGHYGTMTNWSALMSGEYQNMKDAGQDLALTTFPTISKDSEQMVIKKPSMLFAISKNSKHKANAAKLLNFLLNDPEGVKAMSLARGVPSNSKAYDILNKDNQIVGFDKDMHDFNAKTKGITFSVYTEMSKVMTPYNDAFEAYTYGKISASEAAQQTIDGMTEGVEQVKATTK